MDLSADWQLIDDPVTVTLLSRTGENAWAAGTTVNYAQKSAVTKEDIETHGAVLGQEGAVFHLWAAQLQGRVPKVGDKVTHLGKTWQARDVAEMDRDANGVQRYRVVGSRVKA